MNFPLQKLEAHLQEDWLIEGEILFESGQVHNLRELERHLWIAQAEGQEVEIQISPSRVKACTCDCPQFRAEKGCGHIAAALFALRQRRQESERKIKPQKKAPKKNTNIYQLLDQIPPEHLIEFVRDYARQNRAFALALKARFTASLPIDDKRTQYLELLDSAINSVRSKKDQVSFRGSHQVLLVVRELMAQAKDAIAGHHLQEACTLLLVILEKIGPIAQKTEGKNNKIEEILRTCFQHFNQILLLNPAPVLVQTLWDFSLEESKKFAYRESPLQLDFFKLLAQLCPLLGKTSELLDHFRQNLSEMTPDDPNRADLLILIHSLLVKLEDTHQLQEHLLDHLNEPRFLLYVVEEALASGHWKKARFLAEKGLEYATLPIQQEKLEEHLFQLALREKDGEAILHFATARFLRSKSPEYLTHMKIHAAKQWPQLVDSLLEALEQQPYSLQKRDAIARLLFDEKRFEDLSRYISRLQSLDLLKKYGHSWPPEAADQMENLYENTLHEYLDTHLGRKPSERVREMLEHLISMGMTDVADRLLRYFRQVFPQRQSLMEELEAFPS